MHENATTTPAIRRGIRNSYEPATVLAKHHGFSLRTVRRWRNRESVEDRSHTAHRLQKILSDGQDALVICLRTHLSLPLDDRLAVVREFIERAVSHSVLDRMLRDHGSTGCRTRSIAATRRRPAAFKAYYEPRFLCATSTSSTCSR